MIGHQVLLDFLMIDICLPVDGCNKLFVLFVPINFAAPSKNTLPIGKQRWNSKKAALLKRSWSGNMSCWSSLHPVISRRREL